MRVEFIGNLDDAPSEPPDWRLVIPGISLSSADDEFSLGDDDAVSLSLAAASAWANDSSSASSADWWQLSVMLHFSPHRQAYEKQFGTGWDLKRHTLPGHYALYFWVFKTPQIGSKLVHNKGAGWAGRGGRGCRAEPHTLLVCKGQGQARGVGCGGGAVGVVQRDPHGLWGGLPRHSADQRVAARQLWGGGLWEQHVRSGLS
jgi:hypothetical protein